jgi:pilus assembly protein CpaE
MRLLRGLIVCPNKDLTDRLTRLLEVVGLVSVARSLEQYPSQPDLVKLMQANAPDVVFLSFESDQEAARLAESIEKEWKGVHVVGLHKYPSKAILLAAIRCGVRDFLTGPLETTSLQETLIKLAEHVATNPISFSQTEHCLAFLPAKPGVGATTLAVNTALTLASRTDLNVLLADLDFHCGLISFLLKVHPTAPSASQAIECSSRLDDTLWSELVVLVDKLHVLPSSLHRPIARLEPAAVRQLLDFARRMHEVLCVDLSGGFEEHSLEVLQGASRIILVTTSELPALRQAREKVAHFREVRLEDKVKLVVNRVARNSLSSDEVEQIVGLPVFTALPNDYGGVQKAAERGNPVAPHTDLAKKISEFAFSLLEMRPKRVPQRHRFLELFSLSSGRPADAPR